MADAEPLALLCGRATTSTGPSGAADVAPRRISIILPLFDRRNAGAAPLRSALTQRFPRARYEVIAVTARSHAIAAREPEDEALLARCDRVVRTDLDAAVAANEIQLYLAGYERSTGELVFFCEGHTVLRDDCCALIDEHFARHPGCDLAWAPRRNHAASALGALVAMHNQHHEQRASTVGVFSLGATSVIRRRVFDALGGLDARYLRFSETALFHRAQRKNLAIGRIDAPLATHYNDMPVSHWRELALDAGRARFAYYGELLAEGGVDARIRHLVYVRARQPWLAALLEPLLRIGGAALLGIAMRALPLHRRLAYRCYRLALGCADLLGYCRTCIGLARQARADRRGREHPAASFASHAHPGVIDRD
ncbi:MAG: glycosyltransferase [Casimicrobiaceae bacterium]